MFTHTLHQVGTFSSFASIYAFYMHPPSQQVYVILTASYVYVIIVYTILHPSHVHVISDYVIISPTATIIDVLSLNASSRLFLTVLSRYTINRLINFHQDTTTTTNLTTNYHYRHGAHDCL